MVCCRGRKLPKGLKICFAITAILLIIIIAVALALYFTILKPKKPILATKSVNLEGFKFGYPAFHLNITLGVVVTVDNRNYGSFKYGNGTVFVKYRDTPAAQAPILEDTIPARAKHDIKTSVTIVVDNLVSNPYFWGDFLSAGILNFTSTTLLSGKGTVLKFLKIKVSTNTTCEISVFVKTQDASSVCQSNLKY